MIPVLETERLRLRGYGLGDFDADAAFSASGRTWHIGGALDTAGAWKLFAADVGHWQLKGFGWWAVESEGRPVGTIGFHHPPQHPETELGGCICEGAEGRGVAWEAAQAVLDHGFGTADSATVVRDIAPGNARSIRLAERLGARRDAAAARPAIAPDVLVSRHPTRRGSA